MNLATEKVVKMILGLVVILVLVGFLPLIAHVFQGTEFGRFIWGEGNKLIEGPENFVPYTPQISDDEKHLLDSMDALVCAINSVALNQMSTSSDVCKGSALVTGNIIREISGMAPADGAGVKYGDVTITCKRGDGLECEIDNFLLPQDLSSLTDAERYIAGYGDPEYILYYESFPETAQMYWQVDKITTMTIGLLAGEIILNVAFAGKGKAVADVGKQGVREIAGQVEKIAAEETVATVTRRVGTYGARNMLRSLFLEQDLQAVYGIGSKISNKLTEEILAVVGKRELGTGFSEIEPILRQRLRPILNDIRQVPSDFAGSGAYQRGTKEFLDEYRENVLKDIIEGTDDGAVRGLRSTFSREISKDALETLAKEQAFNNFYRQLIVPRSEALTQDVVKDIFSKTDDLFSHELDDVAADVVGSKIVNGKLVEEGLEDALEARLLPEIEARSVPGGALEQAVKDAAFYSKENADEATLRMARESAGGVDDYFWKQGQRDLNQYLKDVYLRKGLQATFELDEILLKEKIGSALKSLEALPEAVREKALRDAEKTATEVLWENAKRGVRQIPAGAKHVLSGTFGTSKAFPELAAVSGEGLGRGSLNFIKNTKDVAKYGIVYMYDQLPIQFVRPGMTEVVAGTVGALGGPVGAVGTASTAWILRSFGKSAAHLPSWTMNHRYPIIILTAYLVNAEDANNEKLRPHGVNTLALGQPTLAGPTVVKELHPDVKKYFLRNQEEEADRLYLVSPCKSKLIVKKTKCDCTANPLNHRYDFGGGLQDVRPGTISLNEEALKRLPAGTQSALRNAVETQYEYLTSPASAVYGVKLDRWYDFLGILAGAPERESQYYFLSDQMDPYFDTSNAIKECSYRGYIDSAVSLQFNNYAALWKSMTGKEIPPQNNYYFYPDYKVDCIELTVEPQSYPDNPNYCFDNFPASDYIKTGFTVVDLAAGIVYGPIGLIVSGTAHSLTDFALSHYVEKWPGEFSSIA